MILFDIITKFVSDIFPWTRNTISHRDCKYCGFHQGTGHHRRDLYTDLMSDLGVSSEESKRLLLEEQRKLELMMIEERNQLEMNTKPERYVR